MELNGDFQTDVVKPLLNVTSAGDLWTDRRSASLSKMFSIFPEDVQPLAGADAAGSGNLAREN